MTYLHVRERTRRHYEERVFGTLLAIAPHNKRLLTSHFYYPDAPEDMEFWLGGKTSFELEKINEMGARIAKREKEIIVIICIYG